MKLHHLFLFALLALRAAGVEIANSQTEFSGTQGTNGWYYGWRNYTDTGATNNYDPGVYDAANNPAGAFRPFLGGDGGGAWAAGV